MAAPLPLPSTLLNPAERPFLVELASAPADVELREVYADWLEEQGDTRAEIVRQLQTLLVSAQAETWDAERVLVHALQQWLAAGHEYAWLRLVGAPSMFVEE